MNLPKIEGCQHFGGSINLKCQTWIDIWKKIQKFSGSNVFLLLMLLIYVIDHISDFVFLFCLVCGEMSFPRSRTFPCSQQAHCFNCVSKYDNKVFLQFPPNFCHIWWFFKVTTAAWHNSSLGIDPQKKGIPYFRYCVSWPSSLGHSIQTILIFCI